MRIKIIGLLALMVAFSSCGDEESKEINLNFKLEYDGEPLVMFEEYEYPGGGAFEFSRFSFYVSEVSLVSGSESTEISDVDYLNLTASHSTTESAQEGYDYTISYSDVSDFESLSMNFGLTDAQNASQPEDHRSDSDLSLTGEYWSGWESYVYVKIEGRMDLDNDGVTDGVALHLGSDAAKRAITIDGLDSNDEITFTIDAKKIFERDGNIYDIYANPRIHSLEQLDNALILMDNFMESIEVSR